MKAQRGRRSFQTRVALMTAVVSGIILLLFGVSSWLILRRQFIASVDARLSLAAERSLRLLRPGLALNWNEFEDHWTRLWGEDSDVAWFMVVTDRQGRARFQSAGADWFVGSGLAERVPPPLRPEGAIPGPPPADGPDARPPSPGGDSAEGGGRAGPRTERLPRGAFPFGGGAGQAPDRAEGGPLRDPRPGPPFVRGRDFRPRALDPVYFQVAGPDGSDWRVVSYAIGDFAQFTGCRMNDFAGEVRPARVFFLAAIPAGLLAIVGGGWLVARRALRPLRAMAETASQMTAAGLDRRVPVRGDEFSEFAELASALNAMMDRLEQGFQQARRFTADASHELKTPIAVMQAEVEAALRTCPPDSPEEIALVGIAGELQRLKQITQGLLLLSQVDAGNLRLAREDVDLTAATESLAEDTEVLCAEKALTFTPSIDPGIRAHADPILLGQALQNLARNAVKYNRPEGSVSLTLSQYEGCAVIEIGNTGPGIPADDRDRVFDRFYRADPARNRSIDGFGLGLNIAREIVRAHGGTLELAVSEPDWTVFRVLLPLARAGSGT